MKVLWFSNSPGNAAEHLGDNFVGSSWISALEKQLQGKVELHIAFYYPKCSNTFRYGETTYHPIGKKNWKFNVLIDVVRNRIIDNQDLDRYLQIINSVKPDIIHIHGTENPFGCIIPHTEIPVVISFQGCLTVINHLFKGGFSKRDLMKRFLSPHRGLKQIVFDRSFMKVNQMLQRRSYIEQETLSSAHYVIGRTEWDKKLTTLLATSAEYFHCDEIMRKEFYEKRWMPHSRVRKIIHSTCGNTPYKGFEVICLALNELQKINLNIEWQVAGLSENDTIVLTTKRMLKDKYPHKGLKLLGVIGETDLINSMCNADIYVSPSYIENSSNSLSEAMLLGMPCIATFVGGTESLIKHNSNGLLVQAGDPWGMAGTIKNFIDDDTKAISMAKVAFKESRIRHDPNKISRDLLNIYLGIINKNKSLM